MNEFTVFVILSSSITVGFALWNVGGFIPVPGLRPCLRLQAQAVDALSGSASGTPSTADTAAGTGSGGGQAAVSAAAVCHKLATVKRTGGVI